MGVHFTSVFAIFCKFKIIPKVKLGKTKTVQTVVGQGQNLGQEVFVFIRARDNDNLLRVLTEMARNGGMASGYIFKTVNKAFIMWEFERKRGIRDGDKGLV